MAAASAPDASDLHAVMFSVRRSVRYHDRRSSFFERLHRGSTLVLILLAGTVIMDLVGSAPPIWIKVVAVIGVVLSALDVTVGFSRHADLHRDLKRRFIALERELNDGLSTQQARSKRLDIEAEEPPIYRALDLLCHNAECMAQGYRPDTDPDAFERVGWFRRATAHVFHWSDPIKSVAARARRSRK